MSTRWGWLLGGPGILLGVVVAGLLTAVTDSLVPILAVMWLAVAYVVVYPLVVIYRGIARLLRPDRPWRLATLRGVLLWAGCALIAGLIALPLYSGVQQRARIAKAQADTRSLARAVSLYQEATDRLPARLDELTRPTTDRQGRTAGPFHATVPSPPAGWSPYRFEAGGRAGFSITSSGDGITVTAP